MEEENGGEEAARKSTVYVTYSGTLHIHNTMLGALVFWGLVYLSLGFCRDGAAAAAAP